MRLPCTYTGKTLEIIMGKIEGKKVMASWFDPKTGEFSKVGKFKNSGSMKFDPPGEKMDGNDWVLVLDGK